MMPTCRQCAEKGSDPGLARSGNDSSIQLNNFPRRFEEGVDLQQYYFRIDTPKGMKRVYDLDHQNGHIFTTDVNFGRVRLCEASLGAYNGHFATRPENAPSCSTIVRCLAFGGLAHHRQYWGKVARNSHAG